MFLPLSYLPVMSLDTDVEHVSREIVPMCLHYVGGLIAMIDRPTKALNDASLSYNHFACLQT